MIETPSAVLVSDHLARDVRFFSLGTNDLIQYSIAVDRLNERIAHLYNPTHPSILRMIKMTVDAGRARGIWTGVCGEMASDILLTPLLIGLGVEELSATSALVPQVKKAVQSLEASKCEELARRALEMDDSDAILGMSAAMARENYGELLN
jgi:phosphotransferase system enzyme I (PtsI)